MNVLTQLNMTLDNDTVGTKWAGLKALCLTERLCMILMYESTWSDCCIMMYNDDRSHITLDPGHSHVYLDGKVQHQHTNTSSVVSVYCVSWTFTHMHNISIVSHSISTYVCFLFSCASVTWPSMCLGPTSSDTRLFWSQVNQLWSQPPLVSFIVWVEISANQKQGKIAKEGEKFENWNLLICKMNF